MTENSQSAFKTLDEDNLLSYTIRTRTQAVSSDGSSDMSPHSTPVFEIPPVRRIRPALISSSTYDGSIRQRVKVHTVIDKSVDNQDTPSFEKSYWITPLTISPSAFRQVSAVNTPTLENVTSPDIVSTVPVKSDTPESNRTKEGHESTSLPYGHKYRPSWLRSESGGILRWKRRREESGSAETAGSSHQTSTADVCIPVPIKPLKPPPLPHRPQSQTSVNRVVVETVFRSPSLYSSSTRSDPAKSPRKIVRPAPLRLLSAPIHTLRKLMKENVNMEAPLRSAHEEATLTTVSDKYHRESRKADSTELVLNKVSRTLETLGIDMEESMEIGTARATTQSSDISIEKSRPEYSVVGGHQSMRQLTRILSGLDLDTVSIDSNPQRAQLASMPSTTPVESATYKIKRSPSAETETFLKIDISVRGQTSYLPSEARRIHTPPLPEDGKTRRGYFFDYNPLINRYNEHAGRNCVRGLRSEEVMSSSYPASHASAICLVIPPDPPVTRLRSDTTHSGKCLKRGDWYDTTLADIDNTPSDEAALLALSRRSSEHSTQSTTSHCRNERQLTLLELQRRQYESQLDYDIPEHLPTSPLCPRNPRYWRVVKNKGSQFRGCWMHGFGEHKGDETGDENNSSTIDHK